MVRSKKQLQTDVRSNSMTNIDQKYKEKHHELDLKYDLENRESNFNRARSITVGTLFGGTSEILMRGDGGRHLWCAMNPVEIVELIHQLAANVGCSADLNPRNDFSSWRDWRVSEAEKKHLNGHPPFVNDMALFQQLGSFGFKNEEAKKIMDFLAEQKLYVNEGDDTKILHRETLLDGAPGVMIGEEDSLIHNKLVINKDSNEVVYVAGGDGGSETKLKNNKKK